MNTVLIILMCIVAIMLVWHPGRNNATNHHKVYGTPIYARLCNFGYYVANCEVEDQNYRNIVHELKIIRGKQEMSDPVFCNKVDEIAKTFDKRFNDYIHGKNQVVG